MKRFLALAMRGPQFDPAVIPAQYAHLDALKAAGKLDKFGRFADKCGGAHLVRAKSLPDAQAPAFADPVRQAGSSEVAVCEWNVTQVQAQ